MSRALKVYVTALVTMGVVALVITGVVIPIDPTIRLGVMADQPADVMLGLAFWTIVTLLTSALPVTMPRGTIVNTSIAPLVVVMALGGPTAAGLVAAVGTTELRELRGRVVWYGTLFNHAGIALPAIVGGFLCVALGSTSSAPTASLLATLVGATVYFATNIVITAVSVSLQSEQSATSILIGDAKNYILNFLALVPLSWLMAQVYAEPSIGWWAILLVVLPIYVMRVAMDQVVEIRHMFTQTVRSLAAAVDARDKFTAGHSEQVQVISVDIGRVLRVSEAELEALEWGGLLHDIGKIGIRDDVLLKQDRLTKEERAMMNAHPVIGANIIAPVTKLAPELPIIRHHHEWYNGSGYPDRLIGDEIPKLARILHVADAFEAMTAARPYRMTPLSTEQAIAELRKYAGVQFDPVMVDAFMKTKWAEGARDPGRSTQGKPVPLITQAAARMAQVVGRDGGPAPAPGQHGGGAAGGSTSGSTGAASADAS